MNCRKARKFIPLHVGGDLKSVPPGLESHLAQCPSCREEWKNFANVRRALARSGSGAAPMPDGEFLKGVLRRVGKGRRSADPAPIRIRRLALRGAAAAVVVASLVLGMLFSASLKDPRATGDGADETIVLAGAPRDGEMEPDAPFLHPGRPAFFGLPDAALVEGGRDILHETDIVPDPKTGAGTGTHDFPLKEMQPVLEAQICADF